MNISTYLKKFFPLGVLSLFFTLALIFSPVEGKAQNDATECKKAADVDSTSETEVKAFLECTVKYYNSTIGTDPKQVRLNLAEITRELRVNDAYQSKSDNMYTILIENYNNVVFNHLAYPELYGTTLNEDADTDVAMKLKKLIVDSKSAPADDKIACIEYYNETKYACATQVMALAPMTMIAGFHHDKNDGAFKKPNCSNFAKPDFTAEQLYKDQTDANLRKYVKSFISSAQKAVLTRIETEVKENPKMKGLLTSTSPGLSNFLEA